MTFEYDPKLKSLYPEDTDAYLRGIPAVDTMGAAKGIEDNQAALQARAMQAMDEIRVSARNVETGRMNIAFNVSKLREIIHHLNLEALPPEVRQEMEDWAGRIHKPDQETAEMEAAAERFSEITQNFFEQNPGSDWLMIGYDSGTIFQSGQDSQLPTEQAVEELTEQYSEPLLIFGRDIVLEPTSPNPNAPSER